ncbi:hypothetical protein P280DRAFT_243031 [Massarina eburnea CBS 473.64]|uniref:Uncharacterized protein n=1 Tax=Massarina eburnea CBS 473.64 TaxID=1395130 RepID=A0A6A6S9E7_9PLEO|nr:hypothetical protein P280DRAFT_243031 [Massarina eburnea CBS 473.64]
MVFNAMQCNSLMCDLLDFLSSFGMLWGWVMGCCFCLYLSICIDGWMDRWNEGFFTHFCDGESNWVLPCHSCNCSFSCLV